LRQILLLTLAFGGCVSTSLQKTDVYVRQQDWTKAADALLYVLERDSNNVEALPKMAECQAELGRIPTMQSYLQKAEKFSPLSQAEADFLRRKYFAKNFKVATARFLDGLYHEATLHFQRAVRIDSTNHTGLKSYAAALLKVGKLKSAEEIYSQLIELEPENMVIVANLAEIYFKQNKYRECFDFCSIILNKNDKDALALIRRAYAAEALGQLDQAESDFLRGVDLKPNGKLLSDLGLFYFRKEEYENAIIFFERALEFKKDDPLLCRHLGEANWRLRNYAQMAKWFAKLLQTHPNDLASWKNLAVAYEALGERKLLAEARHFISRISGTN